MEYIIGIILVIITLIIIGLILRKRVYDEVDRQETWKMEIMSRNIASQLSRIKSLNLSGETQEKFESWKERWEFIVTKELPDIEEYLFDVEEAADRYRFSTAKKIIRKADQSLQSIEADIENVLNELDELMESEESSRKEMEELLPRIKALRKELSQNRYQYGKAEIRFEVEIDELDERLVDYHELVEAGNYIEAKQLIDELKIGLERIQIEIDEYPALYQASKVEIPDQLDDLYHGLIEMKEEGYRVERLGFEKEIHNYQQRMLDCVNALEKGETDEPKAMITEVEERMKEMYQLLEKEAIAKSYMDSQVPSYQRTLDNITSSFQETKEEVELLKKAYYFDDYDMEKYLSLEKEISQIRNQLEAISEDMVNEDKSHTELRTLLEHGFEQVEAIETKHAEFKASIRNLRKDELEARERLADMREQINATGRKIQKSNIPGVPGFIWNMMDEATNKNDRVLASLEKQPLDISEVQQTVTNASVAVEQLIEQTEMMLDQAYLTEQVIQYANRYRSKYPMLAAKLSESERLFRSYEYELALEQAAKAIEEIEPGALQRIEEFRAAVI